MRARRRCRVLSMVCGKRACLGRKGDRFTHLFEILAIDVLRAANLKLAAETLRITRDGAVHVMERAVLRGRAAKGATKPRHRGAEEKAIARGIVT